MPADRTLERVGLRWRALEDRALCTVDAVR